MSFVHSILALMQFGFLLIVVGFLLGIESAALAGFVMVFAALGFTALVYTVAHFLESGEGSDEP